MPSHIILRGAHLHNLKNINLAIPKERLVVLTGLSGSGKSTLGFDILLKEGQRQYLESLGLIPIGMARPPVDSITGLAPSISVDQGLANRSPRSTVGTASDVYTYLRLLFARLGRRPCPACGREVPPPSALPDAPFEILADDDDDAPPRTYPCPHCAAPLPVLSMAHFSFNKPLGACPICTGLGLVHLPDLSRLVDERKSLPDGAVFDWNETFLNYNLANLRAAAAYYDIPFDPALPVKDLPRSFRDLLYHGVESPEFRRHFPTLPPPATVRQGRFEGLAANLLRRYAEHLKQHRSDPDYRDPLADLLVIQPCPACHGARLRPESCLVTLAGRTITALAAESLTALSQWLTRLPAQLPPPDLPLALPLLAELGAHIDRLVDVGLAYLSLDRPSPSLSLGEAQRLRLAALLASGLSGVLYVCDEPTTGLHPRDVRRLVEVLRRLRDLGNTVLVIEHDLAVIALADYVIDLGPGAGLSGGQVVAAGSPAEIAQNPASLTGAYLSGRLAIPIPPNPAPQSAAKAITIHGARCHNLQNITVSIPLNRLVAVTGVSGAGKSSLVFDILEPALRQRLYGAKDPPGEHDSILGLENIDHVIAVDQASIGRLPRSNVATYTDLFTPLRSAFALSPDARRLGLAARHFSFNLPGGRCERCLGLGSLSVQMHFLPPVEIRCPACQGRRFSPTVLAVHSHGLDISQALDLTAGEALERFADLPAARTRLQALFDVGLGYLKLGQSATSLSGGEAQRIKLAKQLGRRSAARTIYLLDEPTTGLHLADVARLLLVLQRLVDLGASVIFIEHNLELIKAAGWVIDLGPEGGPSGGRLLAAGPPAQIAQNPLSYTGQALLAAL